jgi:hypothetical protein
MDFKRGGRKSKTKTLRVSPTLRVGKRRGETDDAANKSLDVSAGQRRCFLCQLACVPRHVNSDVRCFFEKEEI